MGDLKRVQNGIREAKPYCLKLLFIDGVLCVF